MKKLLLGATMAALLLGMAAIPAFATTTDSATGSFVSAPKVPAGAIQVINITYDVTNDEDSGMVGYWALDNYNRVFQVWQLPDGTFYALGNYNGKWQTFAGARSPGVGVVQGSDATGTMHGGWTGTFNAASCTSTFGNVGSFDFGGTKEEVITRKEFPMARARKVLKNETIAIIGYGVQGPAQSLNLRDNGFKVIIGQASAFKRDWDRAVKDGWVPGKTLFEIDEAVRRGTIIQMLVSDAAQRAIWPVVKANLKPGAALYFSHGFSIAYRKQTGVVPPANVDVIMVAPKGSGTSVRRNFLSGAGINSSFAIEQDATGRAKERCLAVGIGIGSGRRRRPDRWPCRAARRWPQAAAREEGPRASSAWRPRARRRRGAPPGACRPAPPARPGPPDRRWRRAPTAPPAPARRGAGDPRLPAPGDSAPR